MNSYAPVVARLGIVLVTFWFGVMQLVNPQEWVIWLPQWAQNTPNPSFLVGLNGAAEFFLAVFLLTGFMTRIAAFLLSIHLLSIAFMLGLNDLGVRDFGLAVLAFSVFLHGPDKYCWDWKRKKEKFV